MRKIRVFINGFGRIGRAACRLMLDDGRFDIVGINDIYPFEQYAYLLQYDSLHGPLPHRVGLEAGTMTAAGRSMRLFNAPEAEAIDFGALGIDVLLQCSGAHLTQAANAAYLDHGVKKVIVSAPPKDGMPLYVMGVNDASYRGEALFSAASCSASAIAPVLQLLHAHAGIEAAGISMVHSYTPDQRLLDGASGSEEKLRSRSATVNILPFESSAARTVGRLLGDLEGRIDTRSIRVPVAGGTLYDFTLRLGTETDAAQIGRWVETAAETRYRGILNGVGFPLASTDIIGDPHGITVESGRIKVVEGRFVRLTGWQDNETGYAAQMLNLAAMAVGTHP